MNIFNKIQSDYIKQINPYSKQMDFNTGDVILVKTLTSKSKKKKQTFVGICIAKRNKGINSSFIIRNIIEGEGVEHIFPLYSPLITQIQKLHVKNINEKKYVRASKLYYLRKYPNKTILTINMHRI